MAFRKMLRIVTVVLGVVAATELGIAAYFYRRTMIRGNARQTEQSKWQELTGISICRLFRREKKQCYQKSIVMNG